MKIKLRASVYASQQKMSVEDVMTMIKNGEIKGEKMGESWYVHAEIPRKKPDTENTDPAIITSESGSSSIDQSPQQYKVDLTHRLEKELPNFDIFRPLKSNKEKDEKRRKIFQEEIEKQLGLFNKSSSNTFVLYGHTKETTICASKSIQKVIVIDHRSSPFLKITEFNFTDVESVKLYIQPDDIRHRAAKGISRDSGASEKFGDLYAGGVLGQLAGGIASTLTKNISQNSFEIIAVLGIKLKGNVNAEHVHMYYEVTIGEDMENYLSREIYPKLNELLRFTSIAFQGKVKVTNVLWW
jgi:hypothetical protein